MNALQIIAKSVGTARTRLIAQLAVNQFSVAISLALAVTLLWCLVEPVVFAEPDRVWKWALLSTSILFAVGLATWQVIRHSPKPLDAALEVDGRAKLSERTVTAWGLSADQQQTPAGAAVVADAADKIAAVKVADLFPIKPKWNVVWVPVLAVAIAAAIVFPPTFLRDALLDEAAKDVIQDQAKTNTLVASVAKTANPIVKAKQAGEMDRDTKDAKLKEIEALLKELDEKAAKEPKELDANKAREKVTELTQAEDKLKKFEQEKQEKLGKLEQQLAKMDKLGKDKDFTDGPAKELNDALAKGDLKKAKEEVDELRKKNKDKKLDEQDAKKLDKQIEKMKDELERLARNQEDEKKLQDKIEQAKKEGKDAETLERELEKMKAENKPAAEEMEQLAQKLQKARDALQKGDQEQLEKELEKIAGDLSKVEEELKDLEDAQDYLQRLKDAKQKACAQCEGGDENKPGHKDFGKGKGVASGQREENKDAMTASKDERLRSPFDPTGKKSYGGSTKGQAFTKKTTMEMGKQIQEAAQEAPQAVDAQRLPRDARDAVKEYFENLGGTGKK